MLFEPLFHHAAASPAEVGVIDDSGEHTWAQLAAAAGGLGVYLAAQTRKPHVGILLPAGAGFVAAFYGTLLAGKAVVPINFLLGEREIAHIIADSGIDTVISAPPLAGRLESMPLKVVDLTRLPPPPAGIAPRFPNPRPDDMAVLMYTSGTSGLPKGVMLTYGNLQSDVDGAIQKANLQKKHHFLGVIPLFHSFGMTAMMLAPVQLGAKIIYMARFSAPGAVEAIRKHEVSLVFGVPSMFGAMLRLKSATPEDFKSIYALICGGEPLNPILGEQFQARFGLPLYEGYGLTETSPVISLNTPAEHRAASVGKTLPGVEVKIAGEKNEALPTGEEGEIWLRGPMVMHGYYQLPQATAEALTGDGFFKTGDIGKVDADGYLYVTGRKKEMIIVAGEKAVPREIEAVLMLHPAVVEAAVIGKKDPSRGEVVVAFVQLKEEQTTAPPDPAALRDFCRQQGLVAWKCPREVTIVAELPRSPTGKVLKRMLKT
jgi:long-chain acyl-CoA synthetase